MSEPGSEWRVRAGVGLLAAGGVPMSDAQREAVARETEKERLQDEAAAKLAAEVKAEADAERAFFGIEKRTVADVLQAAAAVQDRQDRRDAAAEARAAEQPLRPTVNKLLADAKAAREARNAKAEATPVSEAALDRVIVKLKAVVGNTFGKRVD